MGAGRVGGLRRTPSKAATRTAASTSRRRPAAPEELEAGDRIHARSITLSSNRLGLIAQDRPRRGRGRRVTPVDYKRGKRPHIAEGAYDPERVQLCVQGMILEEHG